VGGSGGGRGMLYALRGLLAAAACVGFPQVAAAGFLEEGSGQEGGRGGRWGRGVRKEGNWADCGRERAGGGRRSVGI
jgi:hypothetical protein